MSKFHELMNMENEGDEPETILGQVLEAMNFEGEGEETPAMFDIICHFMCFGWKVVLALLPPKGTWKG